MSLKNRHSKLVLRLVILGVVLNGLILIAGTLPDQFLRHAHLGFHVNDAAIVLPLVTGLTLLYLSSLLARRKQTALFVIVPVYAFVLGFNTLQLLLVEPDPNFVLLHFFRNILFPLVVIFSLLYYRSEFTVKSDLQSFRQSIPIILTIVLVTFAYGTAGYLLMDKHDFHQEIGLTEAMHRTVDQFGLTTTHSLQPYTRRAKIFTDSLSIISIAALAYILISLFQPLRARFLDQSYNREVVRDLLDRHPADSDDFFKLWPHDKLYYINDQKDAALSLSVERGVALVVGDPAGSNKSFSELLDSFGQLCRGNDWLPAFIHVRRSNRNLYEHKGYAMQKIGEEAIVDIENFKDNVVNSKYFRQISKRFTKLNYTTEIMSPPHDGHFISTLHKISDEWLSRPGREERGFMMGYFNANYMQQCKVMVVRDDNGRILAFINQVPSFDEAEANYDLLRYASGSPGNVNDYLLINFIDYLSSHGFKRLNLGLCPLSGLSKEEANHALIDTTLRFVYANGDRLYSFSGLRRFKAKYEPQWSSRYIAYRGGIRGFTRTLNALNKAMKVRN